MEDIDLTEKKAPGLDALIEQFKAMPADELKRILSEEVVRTSASLLRQAASYHVLEHMGERPNVSAPLRLLYRNIIAGKWSPDLYVRFGGEPYVFDKLKGKPIHEQEEAIGGKTDDQVREEVKHEHTRQQERKEGQEPSGPKVVRHVITNHQYDELKRKYDLLQLENQQLRERVADLQRALDAVTMKQSRRRAHPANT